MKNFFFKYKKIFFASGIVAASLLIISGIFYGGYWYGKLRPQNLIIKGISNIDLNHAPDVDFSVFWEVWDKIKNEHIRGEQAIDQNLVYGAIEGMVNAVGDPHTVFMKPDDSKKFSEDVGGSFSGIGAEIGIKNEQLIVVAPLEGSPAIRAGLMAGDKIMEIDGKNTYGINVNDAVKKIRGEIGTKVVLTILRNGDENTKKIEIVRETIHVPTLKSEIKAGNLAYLHLFEFNQNASMLFYQSVLETAKNQPQAEGIILDLRNNPGGYLEVAVNLAGWFLEKGKTVVSEKFRNGDQVPLKANGNEVLKDIPIVVLINKGSASASEILAGALRDLRGVKLIGENSFGKGTVQEVQPLKDGSTLKVTIAQWLLPSGKVLDEGGLKPDIEVKLTEDDIKAGKDPQLDRAISELKKIIGK